MWSVEEFDCGISLFIEYYKIKRVHELLQNVIPSDMYYVRQESGGYRINPRVRGSLSALPLVGSRLEVHVPELLGKTPFFTPNSLSQLCNIMRHRFRRYNTFRPSYFNTYQSEKPKWFSNFSNNFLLLEGN